MLTYYIKPTCTRVGYSLVHIVFPYSILSGNATWIRYTQLDIA